MKNPCLLFLPLAALPLCHAYAADLTWDGGTTDIGTAGDGLSTYTGGTWSTGIANWDQGPELPHVPWNNATIDTAVFGGTYASGARNVTLGSNVTVNQIQINTGSSSGNRYDILPDAGGLYAITFGGDYSDVFPTITGPASSFLNNNIGAKITGTVTGGLVLAHGSDIATPSTSGRLDLTNPANDFVGDVKLVTGNLRIVANLGAAQNKVILSGGALYLSTGSAGTISFAREIVADSGGGISFNATVGGVAIDISGAINGGGNLNRYHGGNAGNDLRLSGDLSGFTGTFENRGGVLTLQPTAPSSGTWSLVGGTVKLNTAGDDAAVAHGPGMSPLLMNGGTLDLNGKSETINGLEGASGTVRNGLAATTSGLTVGAGNTSAGFGGVIQDGNGIVSLTKIGSGSQTLTGTSTFAGPTTVEAGTLAISGSLPNSPITVKNGGVLALNGVGQNFKALTLEGGSTLAAQLDLGGGGQPVIGESLTLTGGTVTLLVTLDGGAPELGTYGLIQPAGGIVGSATLLADFSGHGPTRVSGSGSAAGGVMSVTISSTGAGLVWNTSSGVWDLNTSANFRNVTTNDVFKQYDSVTFGPGSPGGVIVLTGTLFPAAVTVNSEEEFVFTGDGTIGGPATLTKNGSGTLTVETDNSFSGGTVVSGGDLVVDGSLGSGDVTVESSGTLAGSGTIVGAVTIGGTIAPGDGVGTLSTGPAVLSGTYACDIDGALSDVVAVSGNLDLSNANLAVNVIGGSSALNHVIATYTGTLSGSFASVSAGYIVDTSVAGKILLWPAVAQPLGTINFETEQGYPAPVAPATSIAITQINPSGSNSPYDGAEGWSRSTSNSTGRLVKTASSGEYRGGLAMTSGSSQTYIGGRYGSIQYTGVNSVTFDVQYNAGVWVGFLGDADEDDLFDAGGGGVSADSGAAFGTGGTPTKFYVRYQQTGSLSSVHGGTNNHWYRVQAIIGEVSEGNRPVTMSVRNLTTGTDLDFDPETDGAQPWAIMVAESDFGIAPEEALGIHVRVSAASKIDNIRLTAVAPPVSGDTAYDVWMDGFPSITGDDRLAESDGDQDGVKNLIEFVLDGDPTRSDPAILPLSSVSPEGNLVFTFRRRDASEGVVKLVAQYGANLTSWTDLEIGATSGDGYTVEEHGDELDLISVTIPAGVDPQKLFIRLQATEITP